MIKRLLAVLLTMAFSLMFVSCTVTNDNSSSSDSSTSSGGTDMDNVVSKGEAPKDDITVENTLKSISSTDSLGRYFGPCEFEDDKYVGMFYFLWIGQHGGANFDISKLSLAEITSDSNLRVHHYWGEPLYGYYDSGDPWVFRKHLELLTFAGVDYIAFDATNGYFYEEVLKNLLPVALEMQAQGWNIPQFMFYCNTRTDETITGIYNNFYIKKEYDSLWFSKKDGEKKNLNQKPWIVGRDDENGYSNLSDEIKNFFYIKEAQWPNEAMKDDGMPWMSWTSYKDGCKQYDHDGIMSVSVAQHVSGVFSDSVLMNDRTKNYGRGFSVADGKNVQERVNSGSNYQGQWDNALSNKSLNNVFLTGWNEWVAQKQPAGNGRSTSYFVDLYNEEFSRDLEMMKGGYGDNYYLQTAENIRNFKGKSIVLSEPWKKAIDINGGLEQWQGTKGYLDFSGDTVKRDYKSSNDTLGNYVNTSGRNDIVKTRVTYDAQNIYFLVECSNDITPFNGEKNWMNILIEVDGLSGSAWENYQFVINRTVNGTETSVERFKNDGSSQEVAKGALNLNGKYLTVSVPRTALKITDKNFTINFKVADNVTEYLDIMDYYINGDSAPIGRLNYVFEGK